MLSDLIFGYLLRLDEYSDVKGLEYIVALTTSSYKNEAAVGVAIRKSGVL